MMLLFIFGVGSFFWFFDFFYLVIFLSLSCVFLVVGGSSFSGMFFFDGLSLFLVFLSCVLFLYCVFSSFTDFWGSNFFGVFIFFLASIFFLLLLSFSCFSFIVFYVSFELIFLFMFLFLLGWGYSPERLQASFYMVFYTIIVSFPFLVYITYLGDVSSLKFLVFGSLGGYWWVAFFLVFLVKLPVYGVHLWLPKAHVEAPVSGSMVLAGVLLKLGGYGIIRFSFGVSGLVGFLKGYYFSLGVIGGLISCFLCLRQGDMKAFVAYSSVCHMGFGVSGIFSGSSMGYSGGVWMMIAHGFCSSCLFYILYVFYERFYSRSLLIFKGACFFFPVVGMFWFVFSVLNMGVPPSFSFFSEIFILGGVSGFNFFSYFFGGLLLLFSGFYGIFLFTVGFHGSELVEGMGFVGSFRELLNFYGHFFYLVFFCLSLEFFWF